MSYDVDDFLQAADEQVDSYRTHRERFASLASETQTRRSDIKTKLAGAYAALAETVLPDVNDIPALEALSSRLGLHELKSIRQRMTERLAANRSRRTEIEATDLYSNRDLHHLRLETKRNELEPLFKHTHLEWQKLQSLEKLPKLIAGGFGTDQYKHRAWWRFLNREFLDDWRCADAATEALGVKDFTELRAAYQDRAQQMEVLGRDWNELQEQKNSLVGLEEERESLLREETELPRETYRMMGERIAAILENGKSPLVETLPNPSALRSRLNEISGMAAQNEYLNGLTTQLERESASIAERMEKLDSERNRYSENSHRYRNKRFTDEQWGKRFGSHRTARYEPLYGRYRRASDTVYVFNDYNRASALDDFLWWDVMTDGRLDGNFLPEVREWRDHNPDYRYEREHYRSSDSSSNDTFDSDSFGNSSFGNDPS